MADLMIQSGPISDPIDPIADPVTSTEAAVGPNSYTDVETEWSIKWLLAKQKADGTLSILHQLLSKQTRPTRDEIMPYSPEVKSYVSQWDSLVVVNGVIYRKLERPEGGVLFYQLLTIAGEIT